MSAHIHAENMQLYAEDAAKTAKPWELWEFISFGMEDWQTLKSHPNWGFATDYHRKIKEPNQLDAERYRWLRDQGSLADGSRHPQSWRCVAMLADMGGEHADAAIDAAIAAAKENK